MFENVWNLVQQELQKNEFLAGGAILGLVGVILSYLRGVPHLTATWLRRVCTNEIDIPDRTDAFDWVSDWLANQSSIRNTRRLTVESKKSETHMTPAPGWHFFWWKKHPMVVRRLREKTNSDMGSKNLRESWQITLVGKRELVNTFIKECKDYSHNRRNEFVHVKEAEHGFWESSIKRRKRPMDSVILPEGIKRTLVEDIDQYVASKSWYNKMSIPWRRGYLLSGPPGCGKSSIVTAIASQLDYTVCVLNLRNAREEDVHNLLANLSEESILLLEDIDCAFSNREAEGKVTFSGLLNALDGVSASEGRIVFMTTNHLENLDPALIRPGRIDLILELGQATLGQKEELVRRFFPDNNDFEDYNEFVDCIKDIDLSMARLQGHLLKYRLSLRDAISNVKELEDV